MFRASAAVLLLILPELAGAGLFGRLAWRDYQQLQAAYSRMEQAAPQAGRDLRAFVVADAVRSMHRINLSAQGTWTLLCAIIAAIGLHALVTLPPRQQRA